MGYKEEMVVNFLKEGKTFKLSKDIRIGITDNKMRVFILGLFTYPELKFLTKGVSKNKLKKLKESFADILETSHALEEYIKDKTLEYRVSYDYGMGAIGICKEIEGEIYWEYEFNNREGLG